MLKKPDNEGHIADLVLQLSRAAYADCAASGLTQAQWMALRFFARANRFSRNVSGFADFHATTRGTASQTVKSLVEHGYLVRTRSDKDGRSIRFDVTSLAEKKLADDPMDDLVCAVETLEVSQQEETAKNLQQVMISLGRERGRAMVGACTLCGHLQTGNAFHCRLMQESLDASELEQLCVRFTPEAE
jgi:DNA-binding MarR family transcriptional regulator